MFGPQRQRPPQQLPPGSWAWSLLAALLLVPCLTRSAFSGEAVEAKVKSVDLSTVLRTTVASNPAIRAARARWAAAQQKRAQSVALPDPSIEFDPFLRQMTEDDEKWRLSVKQMVPPPQRRRLAGQVSDDDARLARLKLEMTVRNALSDAKETFFELYYIDRAEQITSEIRIVYERYGAMAVGGTGGVAQPSLPESFRVESQRAQLAYDLVQLAAMRRAEAGRLRSIMGVDRLANIGVTASVRAPPVRLPALEPLTRAALRYNQELASAGVEVEKSVHQVQLARLAPVPELMVGAQFMRTGGQDFPGGDPTKDPVMLMVGASIPLWRQKYRAQVEEARQLESAALADRESQALDVEANVIRAHFAMSTSLRLVRLYRDTLLGQSRAALRSAEELYRSDRVSLLALVETISTVHNFELAALRATVDFYQNLARLERITGRPIDLEAEAASAGDHNDDNPAHEEGSPK